ARQALGPAAILGASCYDSFARAERAEAQGASYVAFGAFFATTSKLTTRRAGTALLREAAALGVPRVAIGGITPDNAPALVAAGADLVAVIGGVFGAPDPAAAAQAYLRAFTSRAGARTLTARESSTASRRSLRARGRSHIARHRTKMNHDHSQALFERARARMPGGVNSPVRAFKSVGGEPFFVARADGPYLHDVDGNRYID